MSEQTLAYVDNNSIIHRVDSLSKLAWVVVVIIVTFQLSTTESRAILLVTLLIITLLFARIPFISILRASPLIFGIALLLGLFHTLITPGMPIFSIGPFTGTYEGLLKGSGYFFRLAIMVL